MRHTFFYILCCGLLTACGEVAPQQTGPSSPKSSYTNGWRVDPSGSLNSFFECLEKEQVSLVSAHRAGSYPGYPENALETAKYVSRQIPALHEIDVATSEDGTLFLMHDDSLERTTTGSGEAKDSNWADISKLRLEDLDGEVTSYSPPTLEQFLRWSKDHAIVQIDFKRSTRFEDVINLVDRLDAQDRVIYIAYTMGQARKLHRLAPDAMISVSVNSQSELNSAIAAGIPADRLLAFTGTQDPRPRLFSLLNNRDIEVIFGTLGGAKSIDKDIAAGDSTVTYADLSERGVDIIATDRPLEAYKHLEENDRAAKAGICGISLTKASGP